MDFAAMAKGSIRDYLDWRQIPYRDEGRYLRMVDHDSLVVDLAGPTEHYFWNSQGENGDLANFLESDYIGLSHEEAVKELINFYKNRPVEPLAGHDRAKLKPRAPFNLRKYTFKKDVDLSKEEDILSSRSGKYLHEVRKISIDAIKALGKGIKETSYGDVMFLWPEYRVGYGKYKYRTKIVGAEIQGTHKNVEKYGKRQYLKHIAKGSKPHWGWLGSFPHLRADMSNDFHALYVFESPIDLMSFFDMQLHNNADGVKKAMTPGIPSEEIKLGEFFRNNRSSLISLNGANTKLETIDNVAASFQKIAETQEKTKIKRPQVIHLCLDNDFAGNLGAVKYMIDHRVSKKGRAYQNGEMVHIRIHRPLPGYKDWNDSVKDGCYTIRKQTPMQYVESLKQELGKKQYQELVQKARSEFDMKKKLQADRTRATDKTTPKQSNPVIRKATGQKGRNR